MSNIAVSTSKFEFLSFSIIYNNIIESPIILIVHLAVFTFFPSSLLVVLTSFKLSIIHHVNIFLTCLIVL